MFDIILSEWVLPVTLKIKARKNVISVTSQIWCEDYKKKTRECSLSDSFALYSTALEDVFTESLQSLNAVKF